MRLTNEKRDNIMTRVLKDIFGKKEEKLEKDKRAFASKFYHHCIGDNYETMKKLPKKYFHHRQSISVLIGEIYDRLHLPDVEPIPWCLDREVFHVDHTHELAKEHGALEKRHNKLQKQKRELSRKLRSQLYGVNTLKQLKEVWPDGERYFPKEEKHTTALVVLADEINSCIKASRKMKF